MGGVTAPVLVLRGERDELCPQERARSLADRCADGRCVVLPGAHNTPWTCPGGTSDVLRQVLR